MKKRILKGARKIIIGVIGLCVVAIGIVLLFYPGPGWLVIFAGLAILSTEFEPVQELLDYAHDKYDRWQDWILAQCWQIKLAFGLLTFILATVATWLLNGFGLINYLLNLHFDWLVSPLFK